MSYFIMAGSLPADRLPVRFFLLFVAVVLVLPALIFGGILLDQYAESERADNRAELLAASTRIADAVDRELGVLIMAARVLATSERVTGGNVVAFESEARAAGNVLGQTVFLLSPNGTQLVSTDPDGDIDVATAAAADVERVVAQRQPAVSNLLGKDTQRRRIVVLAPVVRDSQVVSIVGLVIDPRFFIDLLLQQSLGQGWIAALRDGSGQLIARNRDAERFIGTPKLQGKRTRLSGNNLILIETLDGVQSLGAAAPVQSAAWRLYVAVARELVEAPVRRSELWLAFTGAAAMAIGMILAWQLASRIAGPLSGLAEAGRALGAGVPVATVKSRISEVQDVSAALVRADDQLRERSASLAAERARLAAIIETVPVGLLIADASGHVVAGNRQLTRMLGVVSETGKGAAVRTRLEAIGEDGRPVPEPLMPLPRALAGEDPAELHSRFLHADGSLFWAQAVAAPFTGAAGEITGAVLALLDIDDTVRARQQKERWAGQLEAEVRARTNELEQANRLLLDEVSARGRAEDQLRQAQKMEAVGRLTGGIAHDFNNLLTVILGSLELLRRRVTDTRAIRLVDSAAEGANRAVELIGRLLAFSRRQPLMPQPLDVNALVLAMSTLLRRSLGETITIETSLAEGLAPALADPNQLESALLNLAVNARDAILDLSPGGGTLQMRTESITIAPGDANPELRPGDYVMIATIDTGGGMSPEVAAQAFEPFFTTKPHGKGTGLGLSQVQGFAMQSGGFVTIESQLGHGTTVKLFLPRARLEIGAEPGSSPHKQRTPASPGLTVLIVEDEPAVRLFAAEALRLLGHTVVEASSGEQALRLLERYPAIALMISDVVMPGMNGRELAREVERRRPDLPILLASGYSRIAEEPDDTPWTLLPKPFTVTSLAEAIDAVLGQHSNKLDNWVD